MFENQEWSRWREKHRIIFLSSWNLKLPLEQFLKLRTRVGYIHGQKKADCAPFSRRFDKGARRSTCCPQIGWRNLSKGFSSIYFTRLLGRADTRWTSTGQVTIDHRVCEGSSQCSIKPRKALEPESISPRLESISINTKACRLTNFISFSTFFSIYFPPSPFHRL